MIFKSYQPTRVYLCTLSAATFFFLLTQLHFSISLNNHQLLFKMSKKDILYERIRARRAELEAIEKALESDDNKSSLLSANEGWETVSNSSSKKVNASATISPEEYTAKFLDFMNTSPTTYHAVKYLSKELEKEGFQYLSERDSWTDAISKSCKTSKKFYSTRNGSSLVAFVISPDWTPKQGMASIGAHIDALAARLKPVSKLSPKEGFLQLGVAPYASSFSGSGVSTWWDRDLGLGGKVVVRDGGKVKSTLAYLPSVARIPTLAPHFGQPAVGPFNAETQMTPIIGLVGENGEEEDPTEDEKLSPLYDKHSLKILRAVAKNVGVEVKDLLQFDLELFDSQYGTVGGLEKEFLFCPRIDDKICSYCAIHSLLDAEKTSPSDGLRVVSLFDNEEIGSLTRQGARGGFLEATVDRILDAYDENTAAALHEFYANSFLVSADVIHAVNPNFAEVYLEHHKPKLNVGITISCDPNGHMATDSVSVALFEEIARQTDNKLQLFQIRNDSRSGGTIGPTLASSTGMRTIDCGVPQLAMHSIRATTGSKDVYLGVKMFKAFFEKYYEVDAQFKLGDL